MSTGTPNITGASTGSVPSGSALPRTTKVLAGRDETMTTKVTNRVAVIGGMEVGAMLVRGTGIKTRDGIETRDGAAIGATSRTGGGNTAEADASNACRDGWM